MYIVAVIPARGGSKGIPLKNLATIADRPLIAYAINTCLQAQCVDRTVVSTDHEGIAQVARRYGAEVPFMRPAELATDQVTLDPVIYHAVTTLEAEEGRAIDVVLTVQPTCPLLHPGTIDRGVEMLLEGDWDSIVSVREDRHLHWQQVDGHKRPLYKARVNRQELDPIYCETGAMFASQRRVVTPRDRLGTRIGLLVTTELESIDIDTELDLRLAEVILKNGSQAGP